MEITVYHDDYCNALDGSGECNCDPDIAETPVKDRWLKRKDAR